MGYVISEQCQQRVECVTLAGDDYEDVAFGIQKHDYGAGKTNTCLPIVWDAQRHVIWQGRLGHSEPEAIRQLNALLPASEE